MGARKNSSSTIASICASESRPERIDRAARLVELSWGAGAAYDHLTLATGARQRTAWIAGWCAAILRRAFATFGFRNGELALVETINRGADTWRRGRNHRRGTPLTPEEAADPRFDLRKLALGARG